MVICSVAVKDNTFDRKSEKKSIQTIRLRVGQNFLFVFVGLSDEENVFGIFSWNRNIISFFGLLASSSHFRRIDEMVFRTIRSGKSLLNYGRM